MKTTKFLILLFIVNIIILSCRHNNLDDKDILDKETMANIIADICIITQDSTIIDFTKKPSPDAGYGKYMNESLDSYPLDKLYGKYNTNRFSLYKTYMYYLKEADVDKINTLKNIYKLARQIIVNKEMELKLIGSNKD